MKMQHMIPITVKSPFKVCGNRVSTTWIQKNLKWGLYRIQTENNTPLLITNINFHLENMGKCVLRKFRSNIKYYKVFLIPHQLLLKINFFLCSCSNFKSHMYNIYAIKSNSCKNFNTEKITSGLQSTCDTEITYSYTNNGYAKYMLTLVYCS